MSSNRFYQSLQDFAETFGNLPIYAELFSPLIALAALVVSIVSLRRTRRFSEHQIKLEEETAKWSRLQRQLLEEDREKKRQVDLAKDEQRQIEEKKARQKAAAKLKAFAKPPVKVRVLSHGVLEIRNESRLAAKNVNVSFATEDPSELPLLRSEIDKKCPIPILGGRSHFSFETGQEAPPAKATDVWITWEAADGKQRNYHEKFGRGQ